MKSSKEFSRTVLVLCTVFFLFVMALPQTAHGNRNISCGDDSRDIPDHLLLTEICVTPTGGEFIEIHNPTAGPISLADHYLADITDYYNLVDPSLGFPTANDYDFVASFPAGSMIAAGEYQVMAVNSANFFSEFGLLPNYCLKGDLCPIMNGSAGIIGNSAGLTNNYETVVLFQWDGVSDLVSDVDIAWWGSNPAYKINKTGVSRDSGSDLDSDNHTYNTDGSSYPPVHDAAHDSGKSFKRILPLDETDEVASGGNGITGHDETTENLSASWNFTSTADPTVTVPPGTVPIIHSLTREPEGNPTPGTDVTITANITDDGNLEQVLLYLSVDSGAYESHGMNHAGGAEYTYTITYASPPMDSGISVRYNVSATDDDGNTSFSELYHYFYLPDTEPSLLITEVMFNHSDNEDNWIELYCTDDGNGGSGNSILDWVLDDLDSTVEKRFKNVIIRTGELVLLHLNDSANQDEMDTQDGNGDGILDAYTAYPNNKLNTVGDQIVLIDPDGNMIDAVCWAYNDGLPYSSEQKDLDNISSNGQWSSNSTGDCVDSEHILKGYSISRNMGEPDTDSKADWYVMDDPDPGIFYNSSDSYPVIRDTVLAPQPDNGTLLPMTHVNVTAWITDDNDVISSNITWTLNGEPQPVIGLADDGNGADETAGDHNWSGVLPGQPEGSEIVFSVEAFDNIMQRRVTGSFTISYHTPVEMADFFITEVMFKPGSGDNWVEIYCRDDRNDGNGYLMTDWELDDLDSDRDHVFQGTVVRTGEYVLMHYNNDTDESEKLSTGGNADGIIDVFTPTSNGVLSSGIDQMVLFNNEGEPVDAVAWRSEGEDAFDMDFLADNGMWESNLSDSCVDIFEIPIGFSVVRKYDHGTGNYLETDTADDWCLASSPTPGEGGHTLPPLFTFDVLADAASVADEEFTVNWTMTRHTDIVNLTLLHYAENLDFTGVVLGHFGHTSMFYVWGISELPNGTYYLQMLIDDTINDPFTVNTTYPVEVRHIHELRPSVQSTSPVDEATNVDIASEITVTFDKNMDVTSLRIGTTFIVEPALGGEFHLINNGFAIMFIPYEPMLYGTTYNITIHKVSDTEGIEMTEPFSFGFSTVRQDEYTVRGNVFPSAAVTIMSGNNTVFEYTGGSFLAALPNGTYVIEFSAEGYETHTIEITVNGDDVNVEDVRLTGKHRIEIGRFKDPKSGRAVAGINVSFTVDGIPYWALTDANGIAVFKLPVSGIPKGTEVTAAGDETISWKWDEDEAPYGSSSTGRESEEDNAILWIILIVLAVLIVGVIIAIVIFMRRTGKGGGEESKESVQSPPDGDGSVLETGESGPVPNDATREINNISADHRSEEREINNISADHRSEERETNNISADPRSEERETNNISTDPRSEDGLALYGPTSSISREMAVSTTFQSSQQVTTLKMNEIDRNV